MLQPLPRNDRETNNETKAVPMQQPANYSSGRVFCAVRQVTLNRNSNGVICAVTT
jgi:hypothetical protein